MIAYSRESDCDLRLVACSQATRRPVASRLKGLALAQERRERGEEEEDEEEGEDRERKRTKRWK